LLFEALEANLSTALKELLVNGNNMTDVVIPKLSKFLSHPDNSLTTLGIANNDITTEGNVILHIDLTPITSSFLIIKH
jgi:hypothetical protein